MAVQQLLLRGIGGGGCGVLGGADPAVHSWSNIGIIGKSVVPFRNMDRDW